MPSAHEYFSIGRRLFATAAGCALLGLAVCQPVLAAQTVAATGGPFTPALAANGIIATGGRLESTGELTRLTFDVERSFDVHGFLLADPNRVVIELPEVNFQVDPTIGLRAPVAATRPKGKRGPLAGAEPAKPLAGVIRSYRFGYFAPGKSRIVIDLAEPARLVRAVVETQPGRRPRLVVELSPIARPAFLASVQKAAPSQSVAASAIPAASISQARPVVVVDAGHGGVDDGAHGGPGAVEKDIVLEFARNLAARLDKSGRYKTILTRSTDIFIPLNDRVKIAREAGASLFVSIHADTLADDPQVAGATVYTVADQASDVAAARLADKENQSDAVAGVDSGGDAGEVADILFDLTRRETRSYSQVFARTLIDYVGEVARLNKNSRRAAGFRVLKAPDVPSVLLELGYLSSQGDSSNLVSVAWREKVAGAVASAVDRFLVARGDVSARAQPTEAAGQLKESFNSVAARGADRADR